MILKTPTKLLALMAWMWSSMGLSFDVKEDSLSGRLHVYMGEQVYEFAPPEGAESWSRDHQNMYFLDVDQNLLHILTKTDLEAAGDRVAFQPFDLASVLPDNARAFSFAAFQDNRQVGLYIAAAVPTETGEVVKVFPMITSQALTEDQDRDLRMKELHALTDNLINATSDAGGNVDDLEQGFWVITGDGVEILGEGQIAVVKDPQSGYGALLAIDADMGGLHKYRLANPYRPLYQTSFAVPQSLMDLRGAEPELKAGLRFTDVNSHLYSFGLQGDEPKTYASLSLLAMHREQEKLAAAVKINLNDEIVGNTWTKNFLALGLFSSLVDSLDRSIGNAEFDLDELLAKHPSLVPLMTSGATQEMIDWAFEHKLLTETEAGDFTAKRRIEMFRGRKWFAIAAVAAVGMELHSKLGSPRLLPAMRRQMVKVYDMADEQLRNRGILSDRASAALRHKLENVIPNFRRLLVRNTKILEEPNKIRGRLANETNAYLRGHGVYGSFSSKEMVRLKVKNAAGKKVSIQFNQRVALLKRQIEKAQSLAEQGKAQMKLPAFVETHFPKKVINTLQMLYRRGVLQNPLLKWTQKKQALAMLREQIDQHAELLRVAEEALEAKKSLNRLIKAGQFRTVAKVRNVTTGAQREYGRLGEQLGSDSFQGLLSVTGDPEHYYKLGLVENADLKLLKKLTKTAKEASDGGDMSAFYKVQEEGEQILQRLRDLTKQRIPSDKGTIIPAFNDLVDLEAKTLVDRIEELQRLGARSHARAKTIEEITEFAEKMSGFQDVAREVELPKIFAQSDDLKKVLDTLESNPSRSFLSRKLRGKIKELRKHLDASQNQWKLDDLGAKFADLFDNPHSQQKLDDLLKVAKEHGYSQADIRKLVDLSDEVYELTLQHERLLKGIDPDLAKRLQSMNREVKAVANNGNPTQGRFIARVSTLIDQQLELVHLSGSAAEAVANPVSKMFAKIASVYSWYGLKPEAVANSARKGNWAAKTTLKWAAPGAIPDGKGGYWALQPRAEHFTKSFQVWLAESVFDNLGALWSFNQHPDPCERGWGSTDCHFRVVPDWMPVIGGQGPSYEITSRYINNTIGWWLHMPLSYARMDRSSYVPLLQGHSVVKAQNVSLQARELNSLLKTVHPLNLLRGRVLETAVPRELIKRQILAQYRDTHAEDMKTPEGQAEYEAFVDRIEKRTDLKSYLYAMGFGMGVLKWAVNPQYEMSEYVRQLVRKVSGSKGPEMLIDFAILPFTSAFAARWLNGLMGKNHPVISTLFEQYGIEGLLEKVDDRGYTDIATWTPAEKVGFFNLMLLLETQAFAQEIPMPGADDPEAAALWFAMLQERMMGDEDVLIDWLEKIAEGKANTVVKIAIPEADIDTEKPHFIEAAQGLLDTLKAWKDKVKLLTAAGDVGYTPLVRRAFDHNDHMTGLQKILNEASDLNVSVTEALRNLKNNSKSMDTWNGWASTLAVTDTLYLFAAFNQSSLNKFTTNQLTPFLKKRLSRHLTGSANLKNVMAKSGRVPTHRRFILAGVILSSASYIYFDNQRQAHVKDHAVIAGLLTEMQKLLFATTESVVAELSLNSMNDLPKAQILADVDQLQIDVDERTAALKLHLQTSYDEAFTAVRQRSSRWGWVYRNFGPVLMGGSATFWGLYEATSFLTRSWGGRGLPASGRGYFSLLFKMGLLATVYFTPNAENLEAEIATDSSSFLAFHASYSASLVEQALISAMREAVANGDALPEDLSSVAQSAIEKDPLLIDRELAGFHQELFCLNMPELGECFQ